MPFSPILNVNPDTFKTAVNSRFGAEIICQDPKVPADYGFIIVVIITWPEKFVFVIVPEHDITGICI